MKKNKLETYVSPFVLEARNEAKRRAKVAAAKLRAKSSELRSSGDWNGDTKTQGLFDKKLKKQEIFRIEPRNQQSHDESRRRGMNSENSSLDGSLSVPELSELDDKRLWLRAQERERQQEKATLTRNNGTSTPLRPPSSPSHPSSPPPPSRGSSTPSKPLPNLKHSVDPQSGSSVLSRGSPSRPTPRSAWPVGRSSAPASPASPAIHIYNSPGHKIRDYTLSPRPVPSAFDPIDAPGSAWPSDSEAYSHPALSLDQQQQQQLHQELPIDRGTSPFDERVLRLLGGVDNDVPFRGQHWVGAEEEEDEEEEDEEEQRRGTVWGDGDRSVIDSIDMWTPSAAALHPSGSKGKGQGSQGHSRHRSIKVGDDQPIRPVLIGSGSGSGSGSGYDTIPRSSMHPDHHDHQRIHKKEPIVAASSSAGNDLAGAEVLSSTARILEAVGGMVRSLSAERRRPRRSPRASGGSPSPRDAGRGVTDELQALLSNSRIWPLSSASCPQTSSSYMRPYEGRGVTATVTATARPRHHASSNTVASIEQTASYADADAAPSIHQTASHLSSGRDMPLHDEPHPNHMPLHQVPLPQLTPSALTNMILEQIQVMDRLEKEAMKSLHLQQPAPQQSSPGGHDKYVGREDLHHTSTSPAARHSPGAREPDSDLGTLSLMPAAWHHLGVHSDSRGHGEGLRAGQKTAVDAVDALARHATEEVWSYSRAPHTDSDAIVFSSTGLEDPYSEAVAEGGGGSEGYGNSDVRGLGHISTGNMSLKAPARSSTHETALSSGFADRLKQSEHQVVHLDDKDGLSLLQSLHHRPSVGSGKGLGKQQKGDLPAHYPKLGASLELHDAMEDYQREMARVRQLKDAAFRSRGLTMAEVADVVSDALMDDLLSTVGGDLETFIDEYAEKFVDRV